LSTATTSSSRYRISRLSNGSALWHGCRRVSDSIVRYESRRGASID
jgi:hypothetical protein